MTRSTLLRTLECVAIFILGPLLLTVAFSRPPVLQALWVGAGLSFLLLRRDGGLYGLLDTAERSDWTRAGLRFLAFALLLVALVGTFAPDRLFAFVREEPLQWAALMIGYPILSVIPQSLIYRVLFVKRYSSLFRASTTLAGGLTFALAHVVFRNWIAVVLTFVGGLIFCRTYVKTRSFALASTEHALYGCFIFSVGLGRYIDSQAMS